MSTWLRKEPAGPDALAYRWKPHKIRLVVAGSVLAASALFVFGFVASLFDKMSRAADSVMLLIVGGMLGSLGVVGAFLQREVVFDKRAHRWTARWGMLGRYLSFTKDWTKYKGLRLRWEVVRGSKVLHTDTWPLYFEHPDGSWDRILSITDRAKSRQIAGEIAAFTGLAMTEEAHPDQPQ